MEHQVRILIADDDRHTRAGLRALLGTYQTWEIVGEAANRQDAIEQVERCRPDTVLLDLHMPVLNGLQATRIMKECWPEVVIVVLTMDPGQRPAALAAGADAFVSKSDGPERVIETLSMIHARGGIGYAGDNSTGSVA